MTSPTCNKENSPSVGKDSHDRVALTAVRVLEAVEQENKRLRGFVNNKDLVLEEVKRQIKTLEEENKRLMFLARKDANLQTVNIKLRKDVEILRKENEELKSHVQLQQTSLEHRSEVSALQLEQERFLKLRVQKERQLLEAEGQQSKELMEEYVHQIRVLENENDALKQAILDLRKERTALIDRHACEIEGMKKSWQLFQDLPRSKTKGVAVLSSQGVPSHDILQSEWRLTPALKELLLSSLESVMSTFSEFSRSVRVDCESDGPWLGKISSKFDDINEAFNECEALTSARDEIFRMEVRTMLESLTSVIEEQRHLIKQYQEQVTLYQNCVEDSLKQHLTNTGGTYSATDDIMKVCEESTVSLSRDVESLLEERQQILQCLQGMSPPLSKHSHSLVCKVWEKVKELTKKTRGPSVEEFEGLLSELDARSSNFEKREMKLLKELEDCNSELKHSKSEMESLQKALSAKAKEAAILTKENNKLIQKYEELVSGSGTAKGAFTLQGEETTGRGLLEHSIGLAELSKLKSDVASKNLEIKEHNLEIESLKEELRKKQSYISQMMQSIRDSKHSSVKSNKMGGGSSFIVLSTPSGQTSQALDIQGLCESGDNSARSLEMKYPGQSTDTQDMDLRINKTQPRVPHLQTQQLKRSYLPPQEISCGDRWRSERRYTESADVTFEDESLKDSNTQPQRDPCTLAERMQVRGWPLARNLPPN